MSTPPGSYADLLSLDAASAPAADTSAPADQAASAGPDSSADTFQNQGQVVHFDLSKVAPEVYLYVNLNDLLVMNVRNRNAALTEVDIVVRMITMDGLVQVYQFAQTGVPSDGSPQQTTQQLPEGFIISIVASPAAGQGSAHGQTWVAVGLIRPSLPNLFAAQLIAAYLVDGANPRWPFGMMEWDTNGDGFPFGVQIANPGAGVEAAITVPPHVRWRIRGGQMTLVTSAAAGNRTPLLVIKSTGVPGWQIYPSGSQAPNTTFGYRFAPTLPLTTDATGNFLMPFPPDLMLRGGDSIVTMTLGLNPADQWESIFVLVEEWLDL